MACSDVIDDVSEIKTIDCYIVLCVLMVLWPGKGYPHFCPLWGACTATGHWYAKSHENFVVEVVNYVYMSLGFSSLLTFKDYQNILNLLHRFYIFSVF